MAASSLACASFVLLCFCRYGFNGAKPRVWCGGRQGWIMYKRVNGGVILSIVELAYISHINQITKNNILDFVKFESYSLKYKSFFIISLWAHFGDGDWDEIFQDVRERVFFPFFLYVNNFQINVSNAYVLGFHVHVNEELNWSRL